MQKEVGRTSALITGASGGIGLELSKLFAADGHDVVLVARTRDKLDRLANELQAQYSIQATVIQADLSEPAAPDEIFRGTQDRNIDIEFLVNNAGFGIRESFEKTELKEMLEMIQVNITALTHLTRLFLPGMIAKGSGRILNLASTAAFQPGPWMAVYYATKAYVLSLSEALHNELRDSGIRVTALCPGPTPTGFQQRAGATDTKLMKSKVMAKMDAKRVAEKGYAGMLKNKRVVIPGFVNQLLAAGALFGPRSLSTGIAGSLNRPKS
jgi:short-subunit dehydrogenase